MSQRRALLCVVIALFLTSPSQTATPETGKVAHDEQKHGSLQKPTGLTANERGSHPSKATTFDCVAEDTECTKDLLGYKAIRDLHGLIDDDHNGNVDQSESDEFLRDELQYTDGFERHSLFHNNDKLISVDDLWKAWKFSIVYNWTVDDVLDWLQDEVELPQYIPIFRDNAVGGSFLPRLASSNTFMSTVLGIKNPVHKQKLTLKAMDTVLFGPPPKRHNYLKDLVLMVSLIFAVGGGWFGYAHHRYSQAQVRNMTVNLDALQRAEDALTEMQKKLEDAEGKHVSAVTHSPSDLADRQNHVGYGGEEGTEQIREELAATLLALQHAENRLGHSWAPSAELQAWLQLTHELELSHYNAKRQAAERQFQSAKDSCEKIKRRNRAIFGSLRMAHSNSLDEIDQRILDAKLALEEVKQDLQERLQRWHNIEQLCGFPVITNPGLPTLHQILYGTKDGSSRLMAGPGSIDEADEEVRPSGYATLPTSHSKQFLRQRVAMGSTGSLSQMSRTGVGGGGGGGMHLPQPPSHPHLASRGVNHDHLDASNVGCNAAVTSPEGLHQGDFSGQEHPPSLHYNLPHHTTTTTTTTILAADRARSTSLTPSLASSSYSSHPPPHALHHHRFAGMTSAEAAAATTQASTVPGQNGAMSVNGDKSEDDLSLATLDSLAPDQSAGGGGEGGIPVDGGLEQFSHSRLLGPDGAVLTPRRLEKKPSMRKKMLKFLKKNNSKKPA